MMRYNKAIVIFTSIMAIFLVLGFGLLLISSIRIKTYVDKYLTYEHVTGIVSNYIKKDNGKSAIVVEYEVNGEVYSIDSNIYQRRNLEIGESLEILYAKDDPNLAIWMPKDLNNLNMYIFLLVSLVFIGTGIVIGLFVYKLIKNNTQVEYVRDDNGFYNDKILIDECENYE